MSCGRVTLLAMMAVSFISCDTLFPEIKAPPPAEVFDELWSAVDQKYVSFSNRDVDWDSVYAKYRSQISDETSESELPSVLCQMLGELKDGHLALSMGSQQWSGFEEPPAINMVQKLVSLYLGEDKKQSGGLQYNVIQNGMVGYVRYASFDDSISDEQVEVVLEDCEDCHGLILDLRENRGGQIEYVKTLLKYLSGETELYKTLVRHNENREDLTQSGKLFLTETIAENRRWNKSLIVLIDCGSYSASSIFAMCVKGCENVRIIGVKTAGGTNLADFYELSNGWFYRIPTVKLISRTGIDYEAGVPPDVEIHLDVESVLENRDNIIDAACEMIMSKG